MNSIDLLVEAHELTSEDRAVFHRAIQECRSQREGMQLSQKAARILLERRAAIMHKQNPAS
ncbi:MAG: hypothetical protein HY000_34980 [Planctomycetes bacterium]|nr:hypothetical protein [Planctomycetota bacterium]